MTSATAERRGGGGMQEQLELLLAGGKQAAFEEWVHSAGGRHVAREAYRQAARFARRWQRSGQHVSIKLIWELVRLRIREVRARARRRGVDLGDWEGYALNNIFSAYMARHMVARRPEWAGMFELRETGRRPKRQMVIVVKGE